MYSILRHNLIETAMSKWLIAYALLFAAVSSAFFYISGSAGKSLVSLLNVVLVVIPLMGTVFGCVYFYSRRSFIEFLLAQPVSRPGVFLASYLALAVPLAVAFAVGLASSFLVYGDAILQELGNASALLSAGVALTFSSTAIAFVISLLWDDRMQGTAAALLLWLFFSVIYDGMILLAATALSEYPVETIVVGLNALNPVSLARVLILQNLDIAALMGYSGTVFHNLCGGVAGTAAAITMLAFWVLGPLTLGILRFRRKDF